MTIRSRPEYGFLNSWRGWLPQNPSVTSKASSSSAIWPYAKRRLASVEFITLSLIVNHLSITAICRKKINLAQRLLWRHMFEFIFLIECLHHFNCKCFRGVFFHHLRIWFFFFATSPVSLSLSFPCPIYAFVTSFSMTSVSIRWSLPLSFASSICTSAISHVSLSLYLYLFAFPLYHLFTDGMCL